MFREVMKKSLTKEHRNFMILLAKVINNDSRN